MKWSFDQPLVISMGPKPLSIVKVKHGVTEAKLSDGRLVRLSVHLDSVANNKEGNLDITHSVTAEVMVEPDSLIHDTHEQVQ
jgi:hypothetical protein